MKFEEGSVTGYLVKHLEPLTEADPSILAEYVVELLKKDKPAKDLQKLCADNLVEFLGHSAESFVAKLFQALEDDIILRVDDNVGIKESEPSSSPILVDTVQQKTSLPKEENISTSESLSDAEGKEVSDDEDDRNHKHRRREDARPHSFDNDVQENFIRRPNRKRNKPYDKGYPLSESNPQFNEFRKDYSSGFDRDVVNFFEKQHLAPSMRTPLELRPRAGVNQAFISDPVFIGRGRGRSTNPWIQNDSRFNPLDTLDFASGPRNPNLFTGAGLPNSASTQNVTWGAFGFFPGVSNGVLDPLHPLNLQGSLPPIINPPPLNLGMPHQRCRDFEEQGFCLKGDMCPMEHGVNRIVVEDVQSLSQFNFPVSIPSSQTLGIQAGTESLPLATASSSLLTNSKSMPNKNSKSLELNGVASAPGDGEADVYDPDQPLWNNGCPETSSALLWNSGSSASQSSRLSDDLKNKQRSRSFNDVVGSQGTSSSHWGRIRSGRTEMGNKFGSDLAHGNEKKEDREVETSNIRAPNHGMTSQKARRTLFVVGIPQKSNRRESLLSHFRKFGEVIGIYIPLNSDKAFVQFSKREEAEAALKAPDAVMGNRFIKLWWANRDRISDEGQASGPNKSVQDPGPVMAAVPVQPSITDRGKTRLLSIPQKGSSASVAAANMLSPTTGLPKKSLGNAPKSTSPVQKKLEGVELLKELRKKQECFDQKRDLFRKQLAKLEKQALSNKKGEVESEHAVKKLKVDALDVSAESTTPKIPNLNTMGGHKESERIFEKSDSRDISVSPGSKADILSSQESPRNTKTISRPPTPSTHRFKLDNRPTSFRILSPLPSDFANVTALEDHFSSFGDLASVTIEKTEDHNENVGSADQSQNCFAVVTFVTRHSAERAYLSGKCWKGRTLQLMWLPVSSNPSNDGGTRGNPLRLIPSGALNSEVRAAEPYSLNLGKSTCSVVTVDEDGTDRAPIRLDKALTQTSRSSPMTIPLSENCSSQD